MMTPHRVLTGSLLLAVAAVLAPPATAADSPPLPRPLEDRSVSDRAASSLTHRMARDLTTRLVAQANVVRGWLGVVIQDLDAELAAAFGVEEGAGVLVADVIQEGPGAAAGLRPGDVIVDFAGRAATDVPDLQTQVAAVEPGRDVSLTVVRGMQTVTLRVRIGERPMDDAMAAAEVVDRILGLVVEPLTPEAAREHGLSAPSGLLVTEVAPDSAGAAAGINPGDAILEVNRQPIRDPEGFRQAVGELQPGESVPVYLQRGGGLNQYVMLTAPRS